MKFIHLKAQIAVQEVKSKAREVVDRFVALCRKVGGRATVEETEVSYWATCVLPRRAYVYAVTGGTSGLYMDVEEVVGGKPSGRLWQFNVRSDEVPPAVEITAIAGSKGKISNSHIRAEYGEGAFLKEAKKGAGYIVGDFSEIRLAVGKDYDFIHVWLGERP